MAQEPSIDTRSGYKLDITYNYDTQPETLHIPEDQYNNELRHNTCIYCGFQLHDTIYGIPINTLCQFNILHRKHPDKKIANRKFLKPASGEITDNIIVLMCSPCVHSSGKRYQPIEGTMFKIQHPITLKESLRHLKSSLGNVTSLINVVRKCTSIESSTDLLIIKMKKDVHAICVLESPKDMMKYYDEITTLINDTVKNGGKFTLYIKKYW